MIILYLVIHTILFTPVTPANSPVKARIHLTAFPFFSDIGRQLINEDGPKMKIPDFETEIKHGYARVIELAISDFVAPSFDFKLAEDGLHWHSSGGSVNIAGRFKVQYRIIAKITKTGNVRGSASDINIDISAKTVNVNGKPQIKMGSCSANLDHISIGFHGSGIIPWVIDQFHKKFEKAVQKAIHQQACQLAQKALETEVNQKIMEMPSHITLPEGFAVDYSLEDDPVYAQDYIDANINALVLHTGTTCVQKGRRGDWNDAGPHPRMATLWLGEDVANCFASSAHTSGVAQYLLTKDDQKVKDFLRTTCPPLAICASKFFEDLAAKYPDQYVDVRIHTYKNAPEARFDANGIWVNGTFAADVCMDGKCEQNDVLARLVFDVSGYLHPEIKDNKFTGTISNLTMSAKEEFSNIGHVPEEYLALLAGKAFTKTIQDIINTEFQQGLPLPSIHFKQFTIGTTSEVDVLDGAIRLNLDFAKMNLYNV